MPWVSESSFCLIIIEFIIMKHKEHTKLAVVASSKTAVVTSDLSNQWLTAINICLSCYISYDSTHLCLFQKHVYFHSEARRSHSYLWHAILIRCKRVSSNHIAIFKLPPGQGKHHIFSHAIDYSMSCGETQTQWSWAVYSAYRMYVQVTRLRAERHNSSTGKGRIIPFNIGHVRFAPEEI